MTEIDFEGIRQQIFECKIIDESVAYSLLTKLMEILNHESNVLELSSPIVICGDIHGQIYDLVKLFKVSGGFDANKQFTNKKKYLFLGNYVDYGHHSLNTFLLLATLKIQYPDKISLLRGNHESRRISKQYGFYDEIEQNYGHAGLWTLTNEVFDLLPVSAIVDSNIFCVHGGISPDINLVERISLLNRFAEIPEKGPLHDLMWSNPDHKIDRFAKDPDGEGILFGKEACNTFLKLNRFKMICRSNQLAMIGYEKFFGEKDEKPDWKLISIWSAPNFKYQCKNVASVLHVNDDEFKYDDYSYYLNIFDESPGQKK